MVIEGDNIQQIRTRFEKLAWALDERMRRLFAAAEAAVLGHGGANTLENVERKRERNCEPMNKNRIESVVAEQDERVSE